MNRIIVLLKKLRRKLIHVFTEFVRLVGRKSWRLGGPVGAYRILDDPSSVHVVLKEQPTIPATPGSLRDICHLEQDKNQPWPIFWARIPKARLVGPSLVAMNDEKKVMIEALHGVVHYERDPSYNYLCLAPAVELEGPWTTIIARWCRTGLSTYAHWMIDGLPRLALLDRFPADTRILVPDGLFPTQIETLEILGVLDRCRPTVETHLLIEDYYYSSLTSMPGCDNPYANEFLRGRFLKAAVPVAMTSDKIYIARKGGGRTPIQEEEMIDFLQGEGWAIIQAEKYSLKQQITIFNQARAVCSIHGAGLANLIWCSKGCKVLELCAANYLNGSLEGLALTLGLDHRFQVYEADSNFRISVDMEKFKSAVKALG